MLPPVPEGARVIYDAWDFEDSPWGFEQTVEDFAEYITWRYPALVREVKESSGGKQFEVARNKHAVIGISWYEDIVAYWVLPKGKIPVLSGQWVRGMWPEFKRELGKLELQGYDLQGKPLFGKVKRWK